MLRGFCEKVIKRRKKGMARKLYYTAGREMKQRGKLCLEQYDVLCYSVFNKRTRSELPATEFYTKKGFLLWQKKVKRKK